MRDSAGRQELIAHAKGEHSEENLLFYEGAQRFRSSFLRVDKGDVEEEERSRMRERAASLVDQFLADEADYALNLPSHQLAMYRSGLKKEIEVKPNMFDGISRTLYRIIEQDTFARFKVTVAAKDLLTKIPKLAHRSSDSHSSKQRSSNSVPEEKPIAPKDLPSLPPDPTGGSTPFAA